MMMNERESDLPFYEYVHKYNEIAHSGILSPIGTLDPQFHQYHHSDIHKMTRALLSLATYAEYSIMAYRAIEWWSIMGGWMPTVWLLRVENDYINLPNEILKALIKPTTYTEWSIGQQKAVE